MVKAIGERKALSCAGLVSGVAALTIYGLAPQATGSGPAFRSARFMGLFGPAAQALMTREVAAEHQGQLRGANSSLMGLTGLVGPLLFSYVLSWAIGAGKATACRAATCWRLHCWRLALHWRRRAVAAGLSPGGAGSRR